MQEKLYYPIDAKMVYNDCEDYGGDYWRDDISPEAAAGYFENIEHALLKENQRLGSGGLMDYFRCDDKNLESAIKAKVTKAMPSIKIINGELFGVTELELTEPLTQAEMDELKDYIVSQNSDGHGESFEQREIKTPDGDLYISFWSSGEDYFIDTQQEFSTRMDLLSEPERKLRERFDENYNEYKNNMLGCGKDGIFYAAPEIAHVIDAYCYFAKDNTFSESEVEFLLKFENPLEVVSDRWAYQISADDMARAVFSDQEWLLEHGGYKLAESPPDITQSDADGPKLEM